MWSCRRRGSQFARGGGSGLSHCADRQPPVCRIMDRQVRYASRSARTGQLNQSRSGQEVKSAAGTMRGLQYSLQPDQVLEDLTRQVDVGSAARMRIMSSAALRSGSERLELHGLVEQFPGSRPSDGDGALAAKKEQRDKSSARRRKKAARGPPDAPKKPACDCGAHAAVKPVGIRRKPEATT